MKKRMSIWLQSFVGDCNHEIPSLPPRPRLPFPTINDGGDQHSFDVFTPEVLEELYNAFLYLSAHFKVMEQDWEHGQQCSIMGKMRDEIQEAFQRYNNNKNFHPDSTMMIISFSNFQTRDWLWALDVYPAWTGGRSCASLSGPATPRTRVPAGHATVDHALPSKLSRAGPEGLHCRRLCHKHAQRHFSCRLGCCHSEEKQEASKSLQIDFMTQNEVIWRNKIPLWTS